MTGRDASGPAGAPDVSVVLPVYNERESLPILWEELAGVLAAAGWRAEVLFVDDGSTDGSTELLRALCARDPRVRLVRFARNAGLTAALYAGLHRARGRILVTLDSDLQNDPRDIPRLVAALDTHDAATGWRRDRRDPWLKRVSSRVAIGIRNALTRERVHDSACTLLAMHRRCLDAFPPFSGMHRFMPTLLRIKGYRVIEVPVGHRPRNFGVSHYGVRNRAWRAFKDLFVVRWMQRRVLRYEAVEEEETLR